MRPWLVFLGGWGFAGIGAVGGSILGASMGQAGLLTGAVVGGPVGVAMATQLLKRFGWLPAADSRNALLGGSAGFLIAAPIAGTNLHTPVIPVVMCGLAGAGMLIGVAVGRGWRPSKRAP